MKSNDNVTRASGLRVVIDEERAVTSEGYRDTSVGSRRYKATFAWRQMWTTGSVLMILFVLLSLLIGVCLSLPEQSPGPALYFGGVFILIVCLVLVSIVNRSVFEVSDGRFSCTAAPIPIPILWDDVSDVDIESVSSFRLKHVTGEPKAYQVVADYPSSIVTCTSRLPLDAAEELRTRLEQFRVALQKRS